MKKLLFLFFALLILPAYSACPIDGDASFCSIADAVKFPSTSIDNGIDTNVGSKSDGVMRVPELSRPSVLPKDTAFSRNNVELEERNYKNQTPLRTFRQTNRDFSYNASCQFGFCSQTGTPQLFQQRGD